MLRRHLDLSSMEQFVKRQNLDTLILPAPSRRMIQARTSSFHFHISRWPFERDKHAKSGLLSLNGPNKITNIARLDMPRFDLHNDALRLTTRIIHEIDNTVNTSIASLLARPAPFLASKRFRTNQ